MSATYRPAKVAVQTTQEGQKLFQKEWFVNWQPPATKHFTVFTGTIKVPLYFASMSLLVIVRHGQSQWNLENRFTGSVDTPLTDLGRDEARKAGTLLKADRFGGPARLWTNRFTS